MNQLIYYVASSIDGFIADKDGNVDWLDLVDLEKDDHGFNAFYDNVDTLIMGRTSYQQILDFGDWPYPGKPCWVMTSQDLTSDYDNVTITSQTPAELLAAIRQQVPGNTWLVGGGKLARAFHDAHLIDEYFISLIPYILGEGIPLLAEAASPGELRLIESVGHDSGVVQLRYRR